MLARATLVMVTFLSWMANVRTSFFTVQIPLWNRSGLTLRSVGSGSRSGRRETNIEEFAHEVGGWLPVLPEVVLPRLSGSLLADVVRRNKVTAGGLDGWGWREFKVLPVSWFGGLARILSCVEDFGIWPDGLLDAYIAMIPKVDGDATPLGHRPLSVLPVVYDVWVSASRMGQLEDLFRSWVPDSVFSAGGGRSSVEAWCTTALDIEEVLSGAVDSDVHLLLLMLLSLLIRLIGVFWIWF